MVHRPPVPSPFALLDPLPLPAYVSDAGGATVYANPALTAHTGLTAEALHGYGFADLFHPDDRGPALAVWARAQQDQQPVRHEARLRVASGAYRWHLILSRPSGEAPGQPTIIGTLHDIHAQKEAEDRAARLQDLILRLAGAQTVAEVAAALPNFAQALGASQASLRVVRGDELHLVGRVGEEAGELGQPLPLEALSPATEGQRSDQPLFRAPEVFLPLVTDGRPVGALSLGRQAEHGATPGEQTFLATAAGAFAQALERVRLLGEERTLARRTRLMLDALPQLVWTVHPARGDVQFNRTWTEYTGLPERAPFGQAVRLRRFDGTYRWHDLQLVPLGAEEWIGSATDVHGHKEAEAAHAQSEARLSAVLDALPVGVILADQAGRLVRDNAAHRELWGVAPDTASWEEYGEWVGWWPETGERVRAGEWAMARALLTGERVQGELVECQPFGSTERRSFLNNAAPIHGPGGELLGAVVAEQDVTDRLKAERALRHNAERVQLALAAGAILGTWF
ncbi:PAS domain-containing protein [Deinococcus sp. NW-56]|uniref:PAS domain-containing protein n=1 Tax=Deinococcus sp. NW-56 TaxID=2080419 RepID=UPI00131A309B|nr:PAS domain-containing protein [Deinococcus sp. NW-56]